MADDYSGINLPNELVKRIDKIVNKATDGFRSRAEFVTYSIRKELDLRNGGAK